MSKVEERESASREQRHPPVRTSAGDQRQGKKGTKRIHGAAGCAVKGGQRGAVWGLDAGRWRRANKAHQADSLASLMQEDEWPESSIELARLLLGRTKLRTDIETQTLEDAACLVFLETQFEAMAERTEHEHLVSIVAKTLKKMSPGAVSLAGSIGLSTTSRAILADAVALAGDKDLDDD